MVDPFWCGHTTEVDDDIAFLACLGTGLFIAEQPQPIKLDNGDKCGGSGRQHLRCVKHGGIPEVVFSIAEIAPQFIIHLGHKTAGVDAQLFSKISARINSHQPERQILEKS